MLAWHNGRSLTAYQTHTHCFAVPKEHTGDREVVTIIILTLRKALCIQAVADLTKVPTSTSVLSCEFAVLSALLLSTVLAQSSDSSLLEQFNFMEVFTFLKKGGPGAVMLCIHL